MSQHATTITLWDGRTIPRIGFGGWPIAGPFYDGDLQLGYARIDDEEAIALVRRAADSGIAFFDTAAVYGAGHSERLIGKALGNRQDVVVATKFGPVFDEQTKQVTGLDLSPAGIAQQVENSLRRLGRERIDATLQERAGIVIDDNDANPRPSLGHRHGPAFGAI